MMNDWLHFQDEMIRAENVATIHDEFYACRKTLRGS